MFHTQITGSSFRTNVVTRFNFTFKLNNILITFGSTYSHFIDSDYYFIHITNHMASC